MNTNPKIEAPPAPPLLDALVVRVPRACALLAVSRPKLYRMLHAGEIRGYRDGGSRKIELASIKQYIARKLDADRLGSAAR